MNNLNRTSKEEADFSLLKQEDHHDHHKTKRHQALTSSSSSLTAQWLRSKDTRIVRVSRAFGGKDRHSKVCTVRGLRDRRVRLSVSTAIQLYDLQDRLGFNQPSKVVDWLLDAAKHEIDELPPLQIPSGSFSFCHQQPSMNNNNQVTTITSQQNEQGLFNITESFLQNQLEASNSAISKSEVGKVAIDDEKANWNRREGGGEQEDIDDEDRDNVLTIGKNHHHHHHPSLLGLLNTMPLGYNVNNNQWEANSSDVSHSGNLGFENQQTDLHSSTNVVPFSALSSTLSLSTGPIAPHHHQLYFPSSHIGAIMDMDPRQMNQYQTLSSSNYLLMMNSKLRSPNSSETYSRNKDQVFPSRR